MRWRFLKTPSLALRLALSLSLAIAIVAGLYLSVQYVLAQRFANFITQQSLLGQTHDIAEAITVDPSGLITVRLQRQDAQSFDAYFANLKYRVLGSDGRVLASSDGDLYSLMPDLRPDQQDGNYIRTEINQVPFHVAAMHHRIQGRDFLIQVGRSDRFAELAQEAIVPAIAEAVGITAALAMLVLAMLSYWGVRSVLQPIRVASQAARTVGQNNLSARLPVEPLPSEIRPLVIAFNEVLERLEVAFSAQQRFFANAAHELKTPLALLRGQLESQSEYIPPAIFGDIDALGRTVNQLLHVAEVAGGRPLQKQSLRLEELTRQVIGFLSWRAERADVSLQVVQESPDIRIVADVGELFVLLKNLIENAVDHSPKGGFVRISLSQRGLCVEDQGQGVAEHQRTQVFERFWRAPDNTKPGSGLGLAICMEVALAHGWWLECKPSALGGALFQLGFETVPA
jgi:two-component system, OmpR family, sensor histidine kinase QseC